MGLSIPGKQQEQQQWIVDLGWRRFLWWGLAAVWESDTAFWKCFETAHRKKQQQQQQQLQLCGSGKGTKTGVVLPGAGVALRYKPRGEVLFILNASTLGLAGRWFVYMCTYIVKPWRHHFNKYSSTITEIGQEQRNSFLTMWASFTWIPVRNFKDYFVLLNIH